MPENSKFSTSATYVGGIPAAAQGDILEQLQLGSIGQWEKNSTPPDGWLAMDGGSTAGFPELITLFGANLPDYSADRDLWMVKAYQSAVPGFASSAGLVSYNNATSGLNATDVQEAIDVLFNSYTDGYLTTGFSNNFGGDLNTIAKNSTYSFAAASVTNKPTDLPDGQFAFVRTLAFDGNDAVQIIYGHGGTVEYKVWHRHNTAGTWKAWKLSDDGGAMSQRLEGYNDNGQHKRATGDLDLILHNSHYVVIWNQVSNSPADFGAGRAVLKTDMDTTDSEGSQWLFGMQGTGVDYVAWMRPRVGSVWGAWKSVIGGGAFDDKLGGFNDDGSTVEYTGDLNAINKNSQFAINQVDVTNEPGDFTNERGILTTNVGSTGVGITNQFLSGLTNTAQGKVWMRNEQSSSWSPWILIVNGAIEEGGAVVVFSDYLKGFELTGFQTAYAGDLDVIDFNSFYTIQGSAVTNEPSDMGATEKGVLHTSFRTATLATQILTSDMDTQTDYRIWVRHLNGSWGAWKLVVDGGAFTKRLAGMGDNGQAITFTGDLDTLTVNSQFYITANNTTNDPVDFTTNGILKTLAATATDAAVQILYGHGSADQNKQWQRTLLTGVYQAWVLIVDGVIDSGGGGAAVLVGEVKMWPTASIPSGHLLCDGAEANRAAFADLFAVIGTAYGVGNGSTTFNVPDYRGQFLRGTDNGRGLDPDAAGRAGGDVVGSTQGDQNASHTHAAAGDHGHASNGSHQHAGAGGHTHTSDGDHGHGSSGDHGHASNGGHSHAANGSHQHAATGAHFHELNRFESGSSGASYVQTDDDDSASPSVLDTKMSTEGNHQHASAGSHTHASAGTHTHANAGAHTHSNAGGHTHNAVSNHQHASGGSHTHANAGNHSHAASGGSEARPTNININYIIQT